MQQIPDAPWIQDAERRGVDSMYDFVYGSPGSPTEEGDE